MAGRTIERKKKKIVVEWNKNSAGSKSPYVRSGFVFPGHSARCKSSSHRSTIEARCLNQGIRQQPKREILLHVNKSEERDERQREAEGRNVEFDLPDC